MYKKIAVILLLSYSFICAISTEDISQMIKNKLPEKPIILEAGSYDGTDSLKMVQFWPEATIYAFEPIFELFVKTVANVRNYPNVHCYNYALNDTSGKVKCFISSFEHAPIGASSSLLEPSEHLRYYPEVLFRNCRQVDALNLDEWAKINNVNHIDLLWLDMQGVELKVLKAAPEIFKTVKVVFTEVAYVSTYKGVPLYKEVREWYESQGFTIIHEEQFSAAEGNILLVRKDLVI